MHSISIMKCMESYRMLVKTLFLLLLLFGSLLYAKESSIAYEQENNSTQGDFVELPADDLVTVEDTSGLSEDEVRQVAKKIDKQEKKKKIKKAPNKIRWEDLSPTPIKYDWVQTKSGEWFKGVIKGMYDDKLEFDSDEVGLYTFDFDDVKRIKSYHIISVNVGNLASIVGILRLNGDKVTIIQGDNKYDFHKDDIVSFAPDAEIEKLYWSGKITLSVDIRSGNINQADYSAQANIKRRTAISHFSFDYLGRISSKEHKEIANDHRFNQKYDRYITKNFFWTPLFSEYYTDKYKNITAQITVGSGIGYTVINTKKTFWSISGGPAVIYTQFATVKYGSNSCDYSPAIEFSTKLEQELNAITDFTYDYKLTFSDRQAGRYKHHMIFKFENELLSWLDLDITAIWDYVADPQIESSGVVPKRSDYQLLFGFGIEF